MENHYESIEDELSDLKNFIEEDDERREEMMKESEEVF